MSYSKYKHIFFWLFFAASLSFFSVYHYMTLLPGEKEELPQKTVTAAALKNVHPETRVFLSEQFAVCKQHALSCCCDSLLNGPARDELNELTEDELYVKYPKEAGWVIKWSENRVDIVLVKPGLCPQHMERWHLEPDEKGEKIQVYLGPASVGKDGGLVRTTDIEISGLSSDLQSKLIQGYFEFLDWDELIGTLDSLSE